MIEVVLAVFIYTSVLLILSGLGRTLNVRICAGIGVLSALVAMVLNAAFRAAGA
jgi:hypothetical protein